MNTIDNLADWHEFESDRWHEAVRHRGLLLRSLDPDERALVLEAINTDLERRRRLAPEPEPV
jgi:hypothetical protein